jgi:hypothetical protein
VWVSSLVVTLSDTSHGGDAALAALRSIPAITLGEANGRCVPLVIEADATSSRYWFDWIANLPGVTHVELAFVSFEEFSVQQEG